MNSIACHRITQFISYQREYDVKKLSRLPVWEHLLLAGSSLIGSLLKASFFRNIRIVEWMSNLPKHSKRQARTECTIYLRIDKSRTSMDGNSLSDATLVIGRINNIWLLLQSAQAQLGNTNPFLPLFTIFIFSGIALHSISLINWILKWMISKLTQCLQSYWKRTFLRWDYLMKGRGGNIEATVRVNSILVIQWAVGLV